MPDARLRQLIDDFKAGDEHVRGQALNELAGFARESRLAIRTLFGALRDPSGWVRAAAAARSAPRRDAKTP
ncbi:MAG TPA: hypothetical protein VNH11_34260 [Pirellulales bacterium]|nr:hypothetical protein [Pirellulales bacterium]